MEKAKKFNKEFLKDWEETRGFIRETEAAVILGTSRQAILSRIKTGSIKEYKYEYIKGEKTKTLTFVSIEEIKRIALQKN